MHTLNSDSICVALDFETADYYPDSACAIGMAKIYHGAVVEKFYSLIRPPREKVFFTHIHKLTWQNLAQAPSYAEIWPAVAQFLQNATHLAAHNATFDSRILYGCCTAFGLEAPKLPFICTLQASRKKLNLASNSLDSVCKHFGIALNHHHAEADAIAAAEILLRLCAIEKNE